MRLTHFSRLLDIVSGSAFAAAKTKVQKSAIYRDFDIARLNDARFREIITANLPAFYVVDVDLIAKEIVNGLISDPKRFISKRLGPEGAVGPEDKDFSIKDIANSEGPVYPQMLLDVKNTARDTLNKSITKKSFAALYSRIEVLYENTIDKLSQQNQSYTKYRNAAIKFGFDLRAEMQKEGVFIASDANTFIRGTNDQILVIGPTFDAAVRKINESLLKPIEDVLENKYNIFVTKSNTGFKIGNFINAGHTSAVTEAGNVIGVNMPSAQELQFRLSGSPKSFEIDRELGKLYYENNYSVVFNQNYSELGGKLLDMQFAFVITQPAKFNTAVLRTEEQRRLKAIIENEVVPELEEQLRKKLVGGVISPDEISASPSLQQFIEATIEAALEGKRLPKRVAKKNTANKRTTLEVPAVFNTNKSKKLSVKTKKASIQIKIDTKTPPISGAADLTTLELLISRLLFERIKANMGDGSRRDVLNYRTGRFAKSVKLERLSESRQGLITAFYSYMRNPYATFSQGGRQEFPRSRDPKLLISKSIREIAQEQVGNRLRAVLV